MVAEFIVYAGIAAAVDVHQKGARPGTADGVWHLAIMAAIITVLLPMADLCVHGPSLPGNRLRLFGPPGDVRLPAVCAADLLFGARVAFLTMFVLGGAALVATIADGAGQARHRGELSGYRGDGRIAVWIGGWVAGRVPPLAPLLVGLLVTGVLTALGLGNLPGILLLTPAEAMLLAAIASGHPHDGRTDWLVPPLLQAAEYVFLAEIGFAGRVDPPLTFAVVAAAGLRHVDLGYLVRGGLATGIDGRALGWEGRMIIAGTAAVIGIAPAAYGALAACLWWRVARDWLAVWSARHPAVNR
jgi:hypothetical protein